MIVADTSVWIDYINGNPTKESDILDRALQNELVIVGDLILAELLQGFKNEAIAHEIEMQLRKCSYQNMVGYEVAIQSASNYRLLRSKGITVRKTMDMLIATFCIVNDYRLIHRDRDFDPLEQFCGLHVLHS